MLSSKAVRGICLPDVRRDSAVESVCDNGARDAIVEGEADPSSLDEAGGAVADVGKEGEGGKGAEDAGEGEGEHLESGVVDLCGRL